MTEELPDFLKPEDPRALRREYRKRKRANPKFFRAMRGMSNYELHKMEAEVLVTELHRLRLLPRTPENQSIISKYEFDLRLCEEIIWGFEHPTRRQIKRYRSKHDPVPAVPPKLPATFAEMALPQPLPEPMPDAPEEAAVPQPDNVIQLDNFHSKFFHSPKGSVW
jgi:hypothetical protein